MFHKFSTGRWANTAAAMLPKLDGELTRKHSTKPFPRLEAHIVENDRIGTKAIYVNWVEVASRW